MKSSLSTVVPSTELLEEIVVPMGQPDGVPVVVGYADDEDKEDEDDVDDLDDDEDEEDDLDDDEDDFEDDFDEDFDDEDEEDEEEDEEDVSCFGPNGTEAKVGDSFLQTHYLEGKEEDDE